MLVPTRGAQEKNESRKNEKNIQITDLHLIISRGYSRMQREFSPEDIKSRLFLGATSQTQKGPMIIKEATARSLFVETGGLLTHHPDKQSNISPGIRGRFHFLRKVLHSDRMDGRWRRCKYIQAVRFRGTIDPIR